MRFAFLTLGCKVNQAETQAMERLLEERGHRIVPFEGEADVYVVNSCSVTAESDRKTRQAVRRAARELPGARVAVCGCGAQMNRGQLEGLEEVALVGGSGNRGEFVDALERLALEGSASAKADDPKARLNFEHLAAGSLLGRTRALLRAQDGCGNFCTYCIIPHARGPSRSMTLESAVEEAGRLDGEGYAEIILTGIEISSWGADLAPPRQPIELIEAVCRAAPHARIRLGSLEPGTVTEAFVRRLAGLENLCPHFHPALQSGCDKTLRRMGRRGDAGQYAHALELLRGAFPGCAVTTDFMVGFPGEDEEDFAASLDFMKKCGFSAVHIFPYSPRKGTPAASMEGQVSRGVKAERAKRARSACGEMTRAYLDAQVGRTLKVLFEEQKADRLRGHAENYVLVEARHGEAAPGQLTRVHITGRVGERLVGDILENGKNIERYR